MEKTNGKNRSPELPKEPKNSESEARSRSLGVIPRVSSGYGLNEIATGREDSDKSNTVITEEWSTIENPGKFVSQLVVETEKQLAYNQQQLTYHQQQWHITNNKLKLLGSA